MPTILVTGFEAFGSSFLNPAEQALSKLKPPLGWQLATRVLPVSTSRLPSILEKLVNDIDPQIMLSLGESRGSSHFKIECRAKNVREFRIPDNDGQIIVSEKVLKNGPETLGGTICPELVIEALERQGHTGVKSTDAGTYLCNQWFYLACSELAPLERGVGFLHLPSLPEQGFGPGLKLAQQAEAIQAVVETLCRAAAPDVESVTSK